MPANTAGSVGEESIELVAGLAISVDNVHLWVTLWASASGVDVVTAKVAAELEGVGDGEVCEVLVTESNDLALSHKQGELVLASIREGAELDTSDLGTNAGGQLLDLGALLQEIGEGWVSIETMLDVLEGFPRRVFLAVVPGREIMRVLRNGSQRGGPTLNCVLLDFRLPYIP